MEIKAHTTTTHFANVFANAVGAFDLKQHSHDPVTTQMQHVANLNAKKRRVNTNMNTATKTPGKTHPPIIFAYSSFNSNFISVIVSPDWTSNRGVPQMVVSSKV